MNYLVSISVFFKDGFAIEDIDDDWYSSDEFDDAADVMAALEEQHGVVTETQLDGYDLPDWLYDKVGIHGLYELEDYVQRNQIAEISALCAWMENLHYSDPEPWRGFEEHYIGKFASDEAFGEYMVQEDLESLGASVPSWLLDLVDYARVFDSAKFWKQDGYYFYHY